MSSKKSLVCTLLIAVVGFLVSCGKHEHEETRIATRIKEPVASLEPGKHDLNLGSTLFINRGFFWRDGYLYVPKNYRASQPAPLVIWLHGGGGDASDADHMMPIADRFGIVLLSLDSRHNTWDGIDSPFGPDVMFIDKALQHTVQHLAIDPRRVVLAGLSDGGSYALALGRSNGDLFTHLVAVAPWRLSPPSESVGKPRIFVGHGTRDGVYPYHHSRYFLVPGLKDDGYDVTYLEFDGPHWAVDAVVEAFFSWITDTSDSAVKSDGKSQRTDQGDSQE